MTTRRIPYTIRPEFDPEHDRPVQRNPSSPSSLAEVQSSIRPIFKPYGSTDENQNSNSNKKPNTWNAEEFQFNEELCNVLKIDSKKITHVTKLRDYLKKKQHQEIEQ